MPPECSQPRVFVFPRAGRLLTLMKSIRGRSRRKSWREERAKEKALAKLKAATRPLEF